MNIKIIYANQIRKWVAKNYGQSEADNPSWNIDGLAEMLAENFYSVKHDYDMDCVLDDVKRIAEENNIDLDDDIAEVVAKSCYNSDAWGVLDSEYVLDEISYRLKERSE